MNALDWVTFAVGVAGLLWMTIKLLEWRDRHADIARARQHRMGPIEWTKTNTIAAVSPKLIWGLFVVGVLIIWWAVSTHPISASFALAIPPGVRWIRGLKMESTEIQQLRADLGVIVGINDHGRPPKVTTDGQYPAGGPLRLIIAGHPGFQYTEKTKRDKVEAAVEFHLTGDWENVEWQGDGTSIWERLPELPERVEYTEHIKGKPWYEIPVGIDGLGGTATTDLSEHPHWFIAGSTGFGKTSVLRVAAAYLLHHKVRITAVDINYAGLAYLEGRPGVDAAMDSFDQIQTVLAGLRQELRDRLTQLKQSRTYRPPMVVLVDELEVLCDQARSIGAKAGKQSQVEADLLEIARTGRKVDMHLILATQRPEGKTIPTSLRDNALGRLAVGPMSQQASQMVLDQQWARATNTPKVKGRAVWRCGDRIGWIQGFWLADPDEVKHDEQERAAAERLLPARIVGSTSHVADGVGFGESSETIELKKLGKRGAETITVPDAVSDASAVHGVVDDAAEKKRIRDRRYEDNLRKALAADPLDPRHGTSLGRRAHCPCKWCRAETRPNLVEVPS
jgi:ATPase family associated with various cellular activities (AAA)